MDDIDNVKIMGILERASYEELQAIIRFAQNLASKIKTGSEE